MTEAPKPPPPRSSSSQPSVAGTKVGTMDVNVAGALSYFPIIAILWLVLEPYNTNRFVKFHAVQAIGLAVVTMGVSLALGMIPILGWIAMIFLPFVVFVVAVICAVKAFGNEWFKLPVIGDFAEKQANS